jgi:hypothetical protein
MDGRILRSVNGCAVALSKPHRSELLFRNASQCRIGSARSIRHRASERMRTPAFAAVVHCIAADAPTRSRAATLQPSSPKKQAEEPERPPH